MESTRRQEIILGYLLTAERSTTDLLALLSQQSSPISEDSLARDITALRGKHFLESSGSGPARRHSITAYGRLLAPITFESFAAYLTEPRQRVDFKHEWLTELVSQSLFSSQELEELDKLQIKFRIFMEQASETIRKRWYQKWLIEFAWKSSMIEGNTYDELETETLLLEHIEAQGKTHAEAVMILNHQTAIQYVYDHTNNFKNIDLQLLEQVHAYVINGLGVNTGIRKNAVGISGSTYRPISSQEELAREAREALVHLNRSDNVWTRSLAMLLGLSYLQLFEDGNKRTARIMVNGVLYADDSLPLVLHSIDPTYYRRACIAFYELGNAQLMKNLMVDSWRKTASDLIDNS